MNSKYLFSLRLIHTVCIWCRQTLSQNAHNTWYAVKWVR